MTKLPCNSIAGCFAATNGRLRSSALGARLPAGSGGDAPARRRRRRWRSRWRARPPWSHGSPSRPAPRCSATTRFHLRHVAHAQGRVGVEIRVFHLTIHELRPSCSARLIPQSEAPSACARAPSGSHDRAGVDDERELLDRYSPALAIDAYPGDAGRPRSAWCVPGQRWWRYRGPSSAGRSAPTGLLRGPLEHAACRKAPPTAFGGASGVSAGAIEQPRGEIPPGPACALRRLVHEALQRPVDPARSDRPQIPRAEGPVCQIVGQRTHRCAPTVYQ